MSINDSFKVLGDLGLQMDEDGEIQAMDDPFQEENDLQDMDGFQPVNHKEFCDRPLILPEGWYNQA